LSEKELVGLMNFTRTGNVVNRHCGLRVLADGWKSPLRELVTRLRCFTETGSRPSPLSRCRHPGKTSQNRLDPARKTAQDLVRSWLMDACWVRFRSSH
jgi:hypothetical protein